MLEIQARPQISDRRLQTLSQNAKEVSSTEIVEKCLKTVFGMGKLLRETLGSESDFGLTILQYRILKTLRVQRLSNRNLAELVGCSAPGMSRLVASLVKRKLVSQERSSEDRRLVYLALTKSGRAKFDQSEKAIYSVLAKNLDQLESRSKHVLSLGLSVINEQFEFSKISNFEVKTKKLDKDTA